MKKLLLLAPLLFPTYLFAAGKPPESVKLPAGSPSIPINVRPGAKISVFKSEPLNALRFAMDCYDIAGTCRDACQGEETEVQAIPLPPNMAEMLVKEKGIDPNQGNIAAQSYCGIITLLQQSQLEPLGYRIDHTKVMTKQRCCVPNKRPGPKD